jgi:hypothetical protein
MQRSHRDARAADDRKSRVCPTVTGRKERGRAGQGPRALAHMQPHKKQRRRNSSRAHQPLPKLSTTHLRYSLGHATRPSTAPATDAHTTLLPARLAGRRHAAAA